MFAPREAGRAASTSGSVLLHERGLDAADGSVCSHGDGIGYARAGAGQLRDATQITVAGTATLLRIRSHRLRNHHRHHHRNGFVKHRAVSGSSFLPFHHPAM